MKLLSSLCLFVLTAATFGLSAQVPATRGLENSKIDQFVTVLRAGNVGAVANWFQSGGYGDLAKFVQENLNLDAKALSLKLPYQIFLAQQNLRNDRYKFITLQTALEETVIFSGVETAVFTNPNYVLSPEEQKSAGIIRNVKVVKGDSLVQLGGGTLSSHFIAHSQSLPGLASHGLLVSEGGEKPEILEALIEDGTNRRAAYVGPLARFFVLSAKTQGERARVGDSTRKFIDDFGIPFIAEGEPSDKSPLLYDSTMNPDRKKDKYYFCTAVVQEVYIRSGIQANPYPENKSNWNLLLEGSIEQGLYRELSITESRVPAPSDALLAGDMVIRATVLDTAALKTSRRLRAVIDGFYDILYGSEEIRNQLLAAFRQIPDREIRKNQILAALDKVAADPEVAESVGLEAIAKIRGARKTLEQQLPQVAQMRQIAFFILMNSVVQDKALAAMLEIETKKYAGHALPGELRAEATQLLASELKKLQASLNGMVRAIR